MVYHPSHPITPPTYPHTHILITRSPAPLLPQHANGFRKEHWEVAQVHPDTQEKDPVEAKLKGIGFPGLRGDIEHDKQTLIDCYTPAVEHAFPSFKMKDVFADQVGSGRKSSRPR